MTNKLTLGDMRLASDHLARRAEELEARRLAARDDGDLDAELALAEGPVACERLSRLLAAWAVEAGREFKL